MPHLYPWLTAAMNVGRRGVPARVRARARQWMFQWLDLTWNTRSHVRLRVGHFGEWVLYNEIFVNGEYDHAIGVALDAPREPGAPLHVVDLGANIGYFTLRVIDQLLDRGGERESVTITAVEASEAHVREYQSRVRHNGLAARARVARGLVGERSGTGAFHQDRIHGANGGAGIQVPYVDLSSVLARVPRIDLLKCDIEGAEQRLIENYPDVLRKTRVAVFELHRLWCDTERCRALLREYGFTHEATMREGADFSVYTVWR